MNNGNENDGGLQGHLIYSRRAASREAHPVLFWFLAFMDAFVLFAAVYYAVLPVMQPYAITFHQQALAFALVGAALAGGGVLVWRIVQHDSLMWSEREYAPPLPSPEPPLFAEDDRREVRIKTIRGVGVIVQPRPGAFAAWLREVLNPDNKVTFSRNEAKRREWEDWMYINLVAQLKGVGWLHSERLLNGAPDLDVQYRDEMGEWLKTPLL